MGERTFIGSRVWRAALTGCGSAIRWRALFQEIPRI